MWVLMSCYNEVVIGSGRCTCTITSQGSTPRRTGCRWMHKVSRYKSRRSGLVLAREKVSELPPEVIIESDAGTHLPLQLFQRLPRCRIFCKLLALPLGLTDQPLPLNYGRPTEKKRSTSRTNTDSRDKLAVQVMYCPMPLLANVHSARSKCRVHCSFSFAREPVRTCGFSGCPVICEWEIRWEGVEGVGIWCIGMI